MVDAVGDDDKLGSSKDIAEDPECVCSHVRVKESFPCMNYALNNLQM